MSFAKLAAGPPSTKRLCRLGALAAELPPEESEALATMLDGTAWATQPLTEAIRAEGLDVGRATVATHRAGTCLCFREI